MKLSDLITTAKFETTLPVSKSKVIYRPFIVKEQRAMMQAQMDENINTTIHTLQTILNDCTFNSIKIEKLSHADFEWLLLHIRSKSVSEQINMNLTCPACKHTQLHSCHIADAKLTEPASTIKNPIQLDENLFVEVQPPGIKQTMELKDKDPIDIIGYCIKSIIHDGNVYSTEDTDPKELQGFVDSMTSQMLQKISEYLESVPQLYLDIDVECKNCNSPIKTTVKGIMDFLT